MVISGRALVEKLRGSVNEITVSQLHNTLQETPNLLVIDVREAAETALGSIPNAQLIPRGILEMQLESFATTGERFESLDELAEQPVYLLCRSGARSVLSAVSLTQMGFSKVYSIEGGFLAWKAAGYEIDIAS